MKNALIIRHAAPETLGSNFTSILEQDGFQLDALNLFDLAPAYGPFPQPDWAGLTSLCPWEDRFPPTTIYLP